MTAAGAIPRIPRSSRLRAARTIAVASRCQREQQRLVESVQAQGVRGVVEQDVRRSGPLARGSGGGGPELVPVRELPVVPGEAPVGHALLNCVALRDYVDDDQLRRRPPGCGVEQIV